IIGYRPNAGGGFEPKRGVFYDFCERCKENPDEPYFFIIDEINRGNLSKIFGELLMLIETDKRGEEHRLNLVYGEVNGEKTFYVPKNLHIIGMMNTADRSLAMIDYALRRRFSFYTMKPAFGDDNNDNADNNGFGEFVENMKISCERYGEVIDAIKALNKAIRKDSSLGRGFEIGHSYFIPDANTVIDNDWVSNVVKYEIIPLIEEYWIDNDEEVRNWIQKLYDALGEKYDG
ncbi:MAG: AAA family ATPase, partial [Oscillospiraceae bacterium]|nr:AAA family ATPase [Oscillospiraceae bacterium]